MNCICDFLGKLQGFVRVLGGGVPYAVQELTSNGRAIPGGIHESTDDVLASLIYGAEDFIQEFRMRCGNNAAGADGQGEQENG